MKKPVFYIALFVIIWVFSVIFNNADWDLWARLAVGKIFFQLGHVLSQDIFAYTPTKDLWIDHEWGSGVIFYFFAHHFGDVGLLLLKITGIFTLLVLITKIVELQNTRSNAHLNIFLYFLVMVASFNGIGSTVRCQLFTFILFTLWIYVLERVRRGENRLLWIIPATMLVWANLHGGFVSGIGLLVIYGIGEFLNKKPFKKYFLVMFPAILVTLINPYGVKYWDFIFQATTMPRPSIVEWAPTLLFGGLSFWKGYKIILALSFLSLIVSFVKYRPKYSDLDKVKYLLLAITLYLSLKHIKMQPFFVISAGCFLYHDFYGIFNILAGYISSKFGQAGEKALNYLAKTKDIILYSFIIIAGCILIYSNPFQVRVFESTYPVGSVEFIKQNKLSGNVLTLFHWGNYVSWKLYPRCLVAIDGRYEEVYPEIIHYMTLNFFYQVNKNWYDFPKKYHTDILILEKKDKASSQILVPGFWKKVYDDKISAVFIPANKVKKSYIIPELDEDRLIREKYDTSINFID